MGQKKTFQGILVYVEISLAEAPVLWEVDQHAQGNDPHGGHSRVIIIDRVGKSALPKRIIEIRPGSKPVGFVYRGKLVDRDEARDDQHCTQKNKKEKLRKS